MKKITVLLLGIIIMIFFLYQQHFSKNSGSIEANQEIGEKVEKEEIEFRLSGYYYFGFLDQRDKGDSEFEKEYFYNMDIHFQDYYYDVFVVTRDNDNNDNDPEEYVTYFESIGLNLYSMPSTDINLENGDYITFIVKSPIQESYPMSIQNVENVEVLHPRNTNIIL